MSLPRWCRHLSSIFKTSDDSFSKTPSYYDKQYSSKEVYRDVFYYSSDMAYYRTSDDCAWDFFVLISRASNSF